LSHGLFNQLRAHLPTRRPGKQGLLAQVFLVGRHAIRCPLAGTLAPAGKRIAQGIWLSGAGLRDRWAPQHVGRQKQIQRNRTSGHASAGKGMKAHV
jgi:hypothetical protein